MSSQTPTSGQATTSPYYVTTFYHFVSVEDPESFKLELKAKAEELQIKGLIIIGH